jgi:predicted nucleic acid-binding protein
VVYVADGVALIRYFGRTAPVGAAAKGILSAADRGQHQIVVPITVLSEILHVFEKRKVIFDFDALFDRIDGLSNYVIHPLTEEIFLATRPFTRLEIFDRLIVATAVVLGAPIITTDSEIIKTPGVEVIW